MTVFDDDVDMWEQAWADRLLQGESVDGERGLTDLISVVRATAEVPAPAPNAALAALLRDGLPTAEAPCPRRVPEQVRYWGSRTFRAGLAGVAASLAMGAGVATAAAGGTSGPLSYVPEPVKRGVDAAVTAVADVLRPEPDAPAETQPAKAPATSDVGGDDVSEEPVSVNAPATTTTDPAATTSDDTAPTEAPAKPVPTIAPAPSTGPSLPPSAVPSPPAEQSPESSPSSSPEAEGRKPLDNSGSASPSPSPSAEPSEQPSEAPAESGEPAEGTTTEGDAPEADDTLPSASATSERKDRPNRAELTVERID